MFEKVINFKKNLNRLTEFFILHVTMTSFEVYRAQYLPLSSYSMTYNVYST
jgi:hypothetical protein